MPLRILLLIAMTVAAQAAEPQRWIKFDHHTHVRGGPFFGGDGTETQAEQQQAFGSAGYQLIVNSVHSDFGKGSGAFSQWLQQKAHEESTATAGPVRSMGEELRVEPGPLYSAGQVFSLLNLPENKEHLGLFGISGFVAHESPMKAACEWAHVLGGAVVLNHPGPGPGMWEVGYWEKPGLRDKLDAMEAYNDRVIDRGKVSFDHLYRKAISYSGLGLKIAAMGATDNHGLKEPINSSTMVLAAGCSIQSIVQAVRSRRTVASSGFNRLEIECAHLGEVVLTNRAELALTLPEPVERIVLWRETEPVQTWTNVSRAKFSADLKTNTTFSWLIEDKGRHACTSGIWFEPTHVARPDLAVSPSDISMDQKTVRAVIHNRGDAPAKDFVVRFMEGLPFTNGKLKADRQIAALGPGESATVQIDWAESPKLVYVKVDPESFAYDQDDDSAVEADERNNAAIKLAQ